MHYWGVSLEELLERYVAKDDEAAMAELVRQTRGKLLAVARRISGADAEDAVQTAYLSLAKKGGSGGAPVLAWLLTAVSRVAYRAKATRAREHAIAERLAPSVAPPEPPEIAVGKEEAELLRRELWKLPADYRDALQLRYLHGLSGAETARLLGVNESTVRTRLQRGRLLLRSRLARVMHPFLVLPWFLRDAGASAALAVGGAMKAKLAIAALLLAALGIFYLTSRDRAPPPRARTDATGTPVARGAPDVDGGAKDSTRPGQADLVDAIRSGGIVVDKAGVPVEGVRLIAQASVMDEPLLRQIAEHYRSQGKEVPPDAGFRPELVDDAFRARTPLARTDHEGRFSVRHAAAPRETFLFLKEGYAAHEETELVPNMRVVLLPASPLHGRITDTSGAPIGGAWVRANTGSLASTQDTFADADGRYAFQCLGPVQSAAAGAAAQGYGTAFVPQPAEAADFQLPRRWLVVDVTDAETGRPLASARARLAGGDGRPLTRIGHAWPGEADRPAGRCVVGPDVSRALQEGKTLEAVVHVFAPGYVPVLEPVEFRGKQEPPHLRITLRPGDGPPALAGKVTGSPVAHVVVRDANQLGSDDYELVTEFDTAPGGRFLLSGLPRSDYLLIVTAPGMGKVTRRATVPADDIEIELSPAAVLEVLARDRRGAPVAGTVIHVELPDGKRHWTAKTDERGWAVFEDLPAEELKVAAVVEGWNRPIHDRGVRAMDVTPQAGARTQLTVTVPEPLPVMIAIRDEHDRPREGVTLSFETRGGLVSAVGKTDSERVRSLRVTSDAAGMAAAALYEGDYHVMLNDGPTPVRIARLDVREGAPNRLDCVVPRRLTVVRGLLREAGTNQPIQGTLLVRGDDTWALADAHTDARGRFEIRGLGKRKYTLYRLDLSEMNLPLFCEIDLTERDELDLDLFVVPKSQPCPDEVAVTVRSRATGPLAGVRVSVSAGVGDGWVVTGKGTTDASGCAVLQVIEAQRYLVRAGADGYDTADVVVDRKAQRTSVDLDLAKK